MKRIKRTGSTFLTAIIAIISISGINCNAKSLETG